MIEITSSHFEQIVADAIDAIPEPYGSNIQNLVFVVEDIPNHEQRLKLQLHPNETLFGLYEGIPLPARGSNYNLVLPDKITIFKRPLELSSNDLEDLKAKVHHTIWHEVAHYYGLGHDKIHELERRKRK